MKAHLQIGIGHGDGHHDKVRQGRGSMAGMQREGQVISCQFATARITILVLILFNSWLSFGSLSLVSLFLTDEG